MSPRLYRPYRHIVVVLAYAVIVATSLFTAFVLRFDFEIPPTEWQHLTKGLVIALAVKLTAFHLFGRHRAYWRYTSIFDLRHIFTAQLAASIGFAAVAYLVIGRGFPRSIYLLDFLLCFTFKCAVRLVVRAWAFEIAREVKTQGKRTGILIYGCGAAGLTLIREIRSNPSIGYRVVGFLDDDALKQGQKMLGAPVLGPGREAPVVVDRLRKRGIDVSEIVIAMPSATGAKMREAVANCRAAGVAVKTIPGVGELLSGKVLSSQIRGVSVEDLLGRQPVRLEEGSIAQSIQGRVVLVTGGAGSIGSELCRQVASFRPAKLIVLDRAESDLFRINQELTDRYPSLDIVPQICDIREGDKVEAVFARHKVRSVFHAAAYKHVPMMEAHLIEAVHNNVVGTYNLVRAAIRMGVEDFLMISSDKAVNPTNVMGLTKRCAEILVSAQATPMERNAATKFVSVRFGNVLGSNGSVVPTFERQIASGGPVTVTHPEIRRYFMTIREAVQLVLQASTMSKGSEIFVLDMGEPVRIVDLAKNMIRLSGHTEQEIEIRFTGLRPGEKLFEELISEGENILPTYHEKIRIFSTQRMSREETAEWLRQLEEMVARGDEAAVLRHMCDIVPEYQPAEELVKRLGLPAQQKIKMTAGA